MINFQEKLKQKSALFFIIFYLIPVFAIAQQQPKWETQDPNPHANNLHDVHVIDNQTVIAVGENGTIFKTTNGGENWMIKSSNTAKKLKSVHFTSKQKGWAVGGNPLKGQIIIHTKDGGNNWSIQHISNPSLGSELGDPVNRFLSVCFPNNQTGFAVGSEIIVHTENQGKEWEVQMSKNRSDFTSVYFTDVQNGWATDQNGTIYHTKNGGKNWLKKSNKTDVSLQSIHFTNKKSGWAAGSNGTILHTSNGGNKWIAQNSGVENDLMAIYFLDDQNGWSVGADGIILYTNDGGNNWKTYKISTDETLQAVHFIDKQNGWAVGNNGKIIHKIK